MIVFMDVDKDVSDFVFNEIKIKVSAKRDPLNLKYCDAKADYVFESSGLFKKAVMSSKYSDNFTLLTVDGLSNGGKVKNY